MAEEIQKSLGQVVEGVIADEEEPAGEEAAEEAGVGEAGEGFELEVDFGFADEGFEILAGGDDAAGEFVQLGVVFPAAAIEAEG